jgi:BirA family transcriptional regulator, biotin operon repressor / biotin---[acetyl-CoA-carboxylase] ligase
MDLHESRLPLDAARVGAALDATGWSGPAPTLLGAVASTDAEAAALLAAGVEALSVVVAEAADAPDLGAQSPGSLPAGAALWVSCVVPGIDPDAEPAWLVNLASLAVVEALRAVAKVPAEIGWPDGITVPGAACGGGSAGTRRSGAVRVDAHPGGYVVSLVVNVGVGMLELPPGATSLYADGGRIDRAEILGALLPALGRRVAAWRGGDPEARRAYLDRCQTLGRLVRVGGAEGRVAGVDDTGDLVVDVDGVARALARADAELALV